MHGLATQPSMENWASHLWHLLGVLTPAALPASGILVCGNPLPRAPDFFVPQPEGQPPQDISLGTPSLPSNSLPSTCKSLVNQKKDVLES